jgi:hypothetical protein
MRRGGKTMKRKPIETSEELVRVFANLFNDVEPVTPEEVDERLQITGHDPDEVAAKMKATAKEAFAKMVPLDSSAQIAFEYDRKAPNCPKCGARMIFLTKMGVMITWECVTSGCDHQQQETREQFRKRTASSWW